MCAQYAAPDGTEKQPELMRQESVLAPVRAPRLSAPYHQITAHERLHWFVSGTIGPAHLAGGLFTSAFGTALDRPKEYGPGWPGFGERFGMRLTGVATSNAIEATAGALRGEDPRYFRAPDERFGGRVKNVIWQAFFARSTEGNFTFAYARATAIAGNNFLSNTWRPNSEAKVHDALLRTGEGFAGRMASNAFEEFWPDVKHYVFHRHESRADD